MRSLKKYENNKQESKQQKPRNEVVCLGDKSFRQALQ